MRRVRGHRDPRPHGAARGVPGRGGGPDAAAGPRAGGGQRQHRRHGRVLVAPSTPTSSCSRLERNEGGAGGFHEGMRRAHAEGGCDWLWLMDDDTIAAPDALERLLEAPRGSTGRRRRCWPARSCGRDGRIHPMNPPRPGRMSDMDARGRGVRARRRAAALRHVPLAARARRRGRSATACRARTSSSGATTSTSPARVLRAASPATSCPTAWRCTRPAAANAPWTGGDRFFYAVRNGLWVVLGDALHPRERPFHLLVVAAQIERFLSFERWSPRAIGIVMRGLGRGLRPPAR